VIWRVRRVLTGHDAQGRSTFIADGPAPNVKEMSAMPEATALPLTGIVVDRSGGQPETIELILGDREYSHLTHVIDRPTALRVERHWLNSVRLLISEASGTATLVEIAGVPQPSADALAAASLQF